MMLHAAVPCHAAQVVVAGQSDLLGAAEPAGAGGSVMSLFNKGHGRSTTSVGWMYCCRCTADVLLMYCFHLLIYCFHLLMYCFYHVLMCC